MTLARRVHCLAVLLLTAAVLTGCTRTIAGQPVAAKDLALGPVDTSFIQGTDGGEIDEVAAAGLLDIRSYWRRNFEDVFDQPWRDLAGGFHSVDSSDPHAASPPCANRPGDVEGNAYYCPRAEAIVWDRAALLPVLADRFGEAAVVVVLAHEMGHAVHHRLGLDPALQQQRPQAYPTVLTEAMADCYAGSFVRWVSEGNAEHLDIEPDELDLALGALVTFRDPMGISAGDLAAHGNGFDRVSAFQDGYDHGAATCSVFSVHNREFTQEAFSSVTDAASGATLPLDRLVATIAPDVGSYFGRIVAQRGGRWQSPQLRSIGRTPRCSGDQGPVAFCPDDDTIEIDLSGELARLHTEIGDYATGVLLATRYAQAALDGLGRPLEGRVAARTALCLAGAYSGDLLGGAEGWQLSPGDLDEAVQLLLAADYGSPDAGGEAQSTGFERVAAFRDGTLDGVAACAL